MDATLENPGRTPDLSDDEVTQMRTHLLGELERQASARERRPRLRSLATGRSRRVVAVTAAVLAGLFALPALAENRVLWWVQSPDDPTAPVTEVVTVGRWTKQQFMSGESVPSARFAAGNEYWVLQAFMSKGSGLCVGISPDPPRRANEGAFNACGQPVRGIPLTYKADELHWVGYGTIIPGRIDSAPTKIMYGPAAPNVRRVDLENNDGEIVRVATIAAPEELGVRARFWISVLPNEHLVHTIVPRDESGKALEHWRLRIAQ